MSEGCYLYKVKCIKCDQEKLSYIPLDKYVCENCMKKHKTEINQETSFDKGDLQL